MNKLSQQEKFYSLVLPAIKAAKKRGACDGTVPGTKDGRIYFNFNQKSGKCVSQTFNKKKTEWELRKELNYSAGLRSILWSIDEELYSQIYAEFSSLIDIKFLNHIREQYNDKLAQECEPWSIAKEFAKEFYIVDTPHRRELNQKLSKGVVKRKNGVLYNPTFNLPAKVRQNNVRHKGKKVASIDFNRCQLRIYIDWFLGYCKDQYPHLPFPSKEKLDELYQYSLESKTNKMNIIRWLHGSSYIDKEKTKVNPVGTWMRKNGLKDLVRIRARISRKKGYKYIGKALAKFQAELIDSVVVACSKVQNPIPVLTEMDQVYCGIKRIEELEVIVKEVCRQVKVDLEYTVNKTSEKFSSTLDQLCSIVSTETLYDKLYNVHFMHYTVKERVEAALEAIDFMKYLPWDLNRAKRKFQGERIITSRLKNPLKRKIIMYATESIIDVEDAQILLDLYSKHEAHEYFSTYGGCIDKHRTSNYTSRTTKEGSCVR